MLVYTKDYDYRILKSFETQIQSPGLNHSKLTQHREFRTKAFTRIRVSVYGKTKMAVLSGSNL